MLLPHAQSPALRAWRFSVPNSETELLRVELLRRYGGDEQLLSDIIQLFLEDLPGMVDSIRNTLDAGEQEPLARSVHSLKGAVSNFDRAAAREAIVSMEQAAKAGDFDTSRQLFVAVELAMHVLADALRAALAAEVHANTDR